VIDSTGLKVFVKANGKSKTRQRTPSYLAKAASAVDSNTHEIICADLSLNNVTDSEAFPGLIRQTQKNQGSIGRLLTTPGSVTMNCGVRKSARLSCPEKVRVTGPVNMQTVTVQWLISG
jgi:hypothetical protein